MQKYTFLAAVVLLCAFCATTDAQIFSFFGSIVGSVLITAANIIGAAISITSAVITFAITTTIFITQATFSIILGVNYGLYNALTRNNATVSAAANVTATFNQQLLNCSSRASRVAALLASHSIGSFSDSITDVSFTLSAAGLALVGTRYGYAPYRSVYIDGFSYISSTNLCFPTSSNATIACQVSAFSYAANRTIANLNRTALWYQKVNNYLNANCSAPNVTSIQNLTQQWVSLNSAISAYGNITIVNGTLLAYVNATLGVNITNTFNQTQELIESFKNATACLVTAACNTTRNSTFTFSSWADFSVVGSWHANRFRRASYLTSFNGYNYYVNAATSLWSQLRSAASTIRSTYTSYYSNILNVKVLDFNTAATNYANALDSFITAFNSSSVSISAVLNATINATEYIKYSLFNNATFAVNATAAAFVAQVIAGNSSYPQCTEASLNASANVYANFSIDAQSCGDIADAANALQYAYVGNYTANLTASFNFHTNATGRCFQWYCANNTNSYANIGYQCVKDSSFTYSFFFVPFLTTTGQNWVNCFSSVTANVTATASVTSTGTTSILSNLQTQIANITATLQSCLSAKVNFTASAFASLNETYTNCTLDETTTAATTTTTVAATTEADLPTTTTVGV